MNHVSQRDLEYLDDEHLSDALILEYLSEDEDRPGLSGQRISAHLEKCDDCGQRVLSAFRTLEGLRASDCASPAPYHYCPSQEILDEIASGTASSEIAAHNIRHAADCDHCGPLLKKLLEIYSEGLTPEDSKLLAEVQGSAAAAWQKQMVRTIVNEGKPAPAWRAWFLWPRMLATSAMATIAAIAGITQAPALINWYELRQADRLFAEAVTAPPNERATLMRLESEPWVEYAVQLAPGRNIRDDVSFLRIKYFVSSTLESRGEKADPRWLQLKGRIYLMEHGPESLEVAEQAMEEAAAKGLDTPSLQIDRAAVDFERASTVNPEQPHPPILRKTIDRLNKVLIDPRLTPQERAVALFDLAYAYEKTELWDSAAFTWQEYRKLDSTSDWAKEAGSHLEEATLKLRNPEPEHFDEPSYFLGPAAQQESHLEQYINISLQKWLRPAVEFPNGEAAQAMKKLAALLADEKHSDPMLEDLLRRLAKEDLPAVDDLSAALDDNQKNHYEDDGAVQKSSRAIEWFAARGNLPGELLSRYAKIYALRRSLKSGCLNEIGEISSRLAGTKYYLLKGQVALETAQCANLNTDYEQARKGAELSASLAAVYRFPDLALRVIGIEAGMKRLQRDYDGAWLECMAGLKQYWEYPQSPERLYQFYAVLWQLAGDTKEPYAEEALVRQGIRIREKYFQNDALMLALLQIKLANNLREDTGSAARKAEARKSTETALHLIDQAPDKITAQKYLLSTQITFADKKLATAESMTDPARKREVIDLALAAIEPVRKLLESQHDFVQLDFYRVRANANRQLAQLHSDNPNERLARLNAAVSDYQSAIERSERSLEAMRDDSGRAKWVLKTDEIHRGLVWTLLKLKEDKKALYIWERLRSRSLGISNTVDPPLDRLYLQDITRDPQPLPVTDFHLIYAAFREGVQIWSVDGPVVKSTWVEIGQEQLAKMVGEFAKQSAHKSGSSDRATDIYSRLVWPIAAGLPASRPIVVELDQALSKLPLEALPLPGAEKEYFGTRYQVVRSPGIFAEKTLREPRPLPARAAFLLVDPSAEQGHALQADAIKRTFVSARVIDAMDVKRPLIMQALPASYGFHFTGHGSGTTLYLNPRVGVTAADFSPDALRKVQLAVLAACSTGATQNGTLDPDNLVRSFLRAGVPSVVASQWAVDAASTAELMSNFYAHLGQGDSPAAALQKARREMVASGKTPYYWAAFTLTGRAN